MSTNSAQCFANNALLDMATSIDAGKSDDEIRQIVAEREAAQRPQNKNGAKTLIGKKTRIGKRTFIGGLPVARQY